MTLDRDVTISCGYGVTLEYRDLRYSKELLDSLNQAYTIPNNVLDMWRDLTLKDVMLAGEYKPYCGNFCKDGVLKDEDSWRSKDNYCDCKLGIARRESKLVKKIAPLLNIGEPTHSKPIPCLMPDCGGIIVFHRDADTVNGPGEWYSACNKCLCSEDDLDY